MIMNKNSQQSGKFQNNLACRDKKQKGSSLSKNGDYGESNPKNRQPAVSNCYFQQMKKISFLETDNLKSSCKVWTTDESNPCHSSNELNSINEAPLNSRKNIYTSPFLPYQSPREQSRTASRLKKLPKKGRKCILQLFNSRLDQLSNLQRRHQYEVSEAKESMHEHQVSRLMKIHSMQRLHTVNKLKNRTKKDLKLS